MVITLKDQVSIDQMIAEIRRSVIAYESVIDAIRTRGLDTEYYEIEQFKHIKLAEWLEELRGHKGGGQPVIQGEWLLDGELPDHRGALNPVWTCSECGKSFGTNKFKFCPDCGTPMKVEKE